MKTCTLLLDPADVLMCRDGRPLEQVTQDSRSEFPNPRTTSGALRNWLFSSLGVNLGKLRMGIAGMGSTTRETLASKIDPAHHWVLDVYFRGPLPHKDGRDTFFPLPSHYAHPTENTGKKDLIQLKPLQHTPAGYRAPTGTPSSFRPMSTMDDYKHHASGQFLRSEDMYQALLGEQLQLDDLFQVTKYEYRTGLALDSDTRTAAEGLLYSSAFLRLLDKDNAPLSLRVDVCLPEERVQLLGDLVKCNPFVRFGGEGKAAGLRLCQTSLPLPDKSSWATVERFCTVLITPGIFTAGNIPSNLSKHFKLVSALTLPPQTFSGWDLALNRPCPTRYAVPAGSAYFWERPEKALNGIEDPHGTCISDNLEDCQAGWGLCLRGEWTYA